MVPTTFKLVVKERGEAGGADKGTEYVLEEATITIGRDKACQLVLPQQAVSRSHARITRDGQLFFLEDLGSAYGTTINGQKMPKGEKRLLQDEDVIAIAQFDLTFERVQDLPSGTEPTAMVARQLVKDVMRGLVAGDGPYFRVMNGPKEGQKIEIRDVQELVIGRDENADVILKDDLVSRLHAKIRRDWSGTHVEDLQSRNGVKVNRRRIRRKTLHDRDEVEIGGIRLLYLDPTEVREEPAQVEDDREESTSSEASVLKVQPDGVQTRAAIDLEQEEVRRVKETAAAEAKAAEEAQKAEAEAKAKAEAEAGGEDKPEGEDEEGSDEPLAPAINPVYVMIGVGTVAFLALLMMIAVFVG
jgi:pSer/pThr/pTyr-binding forkhead associated (FHA) protein